MSEEPVAYLVNKEPEAVHYVLEEKPVIADDKKITPLYTKGQLQPKVKLTQAEFDEWQEIFDDFEFFSDAMSKGVTVEKHVKLLNKIYSTKYNDLSSLEIEVKFAVLWANYNPDNPEDTIEIVEEKKWFVRSKELDDEGYYAFLANLVQLNENWCYSKDKQKPYKSAVKFDTKEEAELWVTPLTEAVLLPVEGK